MMTTTMMMIMIMIIRKKTIAAKLLNLLDVAGSNDPFASRPGKYTSAYVYTGRMDMSSGVTPKGCAHKLCAHVIDCCDHRIGRL